MKDEHRPGLGDKPLRTVAFLLFLLVLPALAGCGTNAGDLLYQMTGAAGRTWLDLLLTDVANTVADRFDQEQATPPPSDGEGENGDLPDDGEDGTGDGSGFDDLTGDPAAGESLYASCTACHCADASGGCLSGAPALVGVSAEILDEFLRGDAPHMKMDYTDQQIVDLEAYLASLGG